MAVAFVGAAGTLGIFTDAVFEVLDNPGSVGGLQLVVIRVAGADPGGSIVEIVGSRGQRLGNNVLSQGQRSLNCLRR